MKKIVLLLLLALSAASLQASVLLQDSLNYPYTNGPIAGQGQWYVYSAGTPADDTLVSNNVIYIASTNKDSIATPVKGFYNPANGSIVYASFTLKVSEAPSFNDYNGGYFCQFISTNNNTCCNLFIDTHDTVVPGTFRLSIANFSVSFSNLQKPVTFPEDLCTNVTYNIVIAYDTSVGSTTEGANLMINPSATDYDNLIAGDGEGSGFVYGTDIAINSTRSDIEVTGIGFSPYIDGGISNVIVGTTFSDVNTLPNPPVFGIQPGSGTAYSGNSAVFYSAAAGSDLTYQWYSTTLGMLSDNADITGSTSNILVVNNLAASDGYYVVATDAEGRTATSATAMETVNTTSTPVFFDSSVTPTSLTNNLFTTASFADYASGTGPITYQWYFQSTNSGATAVPLPGQNNPWINLSLSDYTYAGQYYVVASSAGTGSTATGPTNTLMEIAPLVATMEQLHTYLINTMAQIAANPGGTVYINTNNVTVSGYVSVYRGYGSSYSEFFVQDTNGYGVEVFLPGHGNTNTPPIGTYVTVSGPLEVYHSALEMAPSTPGAIVINPAPPIAFNPFLGNPYYADLTANPIGTNALRFTASLVTFTNVYLYGNATGGAFGSGTSSGGAYSGAGGVFTSNSYCILYMTVGAPYDATTNNKTMEIFQPTYDYRNGSASVAQNPFDYQPIPTHCDQLTGILLPYGGSPSYVEVIPSRYEDYLASSPAAFDISLGAANKNATVSWPPVGGATYSVYSATNINGPWRQESYGLSYYPTNGAFSQASSPGSAAKFFRVTNP
jgi:hypothetical protein